MNLNLEEFVLKFFFISKETEKEGHIVIENCGESVTSPREDLNVFFKLSDKGSLFQTLNTTGSVSLSSFETNFEKHSIRLATFPVTSKKMKVTDVFLRHFSDWASIEAYYALSPSKNVETIAVEEDEDEYTKFLKSIEGPNSEQAAVLDFSDDESLEDLDVEDPKDKELKTSESFVASTVEVSEVSKDLEVEHTVMTLEQAASHGEQVLLQGKVPSGESEYFSQMLGVIRALSDRVSFNPGERLSSEDFEEFLKMAARSSAKDFQEVSLKVLSICWRFGHRDFVSAFVEQFLELEGERYK